MDNKSPLSVKSATAAFETAYNAVGINSKHLLHLPRTNTALKHGFSRVPLDTTKRMGHWSVSQDVFETSYGQIPDLDSLCMVSGFEDAKTYRPHWLLTTPPVQLLQLVLADFNQQFASVLENRELSFSVADKMDRALLHDRQAVFTMEYIIHLRTLFIKGAVYFHAKYPDHIVCRKHRLFRSALFKSYCDLVHHVDAVMTAIERVLPFVFNQSVGLELIASVEDVDSDLELHHDCTDAPTARLLDLLCEKIGNSWRSRDGPSDVSLGQHTTTVTEILRAVTHSDFKADAAMIAEAVRELTMCFAKRTESDAERSITGALFEPRALERTRANQRTQQTGECVVPVLPTLSKLGAKPITKIMEIGKDGLVVNGEAIPPLENLKHSRGSKPLYGSRKSGKAMATRARFVRLIAMTMELVKDSISIETVEAQLVACNMSVDGFAKHLADIYRDMHVTAGNQMLTLELVKAHENFSLDLLNERVKKAIKHKSRDTENSHLNEQH